VAAVRKVVVAAAGLAAGCVVVFPAGYAGAAGGLDRPPRASAVGAPIAWGECDPPGEGLQCARIRVPLDWDRPKGRTIKLALIRHLASKPDERIGTLFINPGGPGDTGVGLLQGDPEGIDAFGGGRFDVVSWDPRGTNASTKTVCFRSDAAQSRFWAGDAYPMTRAQAKRFMPHAAELARRCGKVSGWLLPHISTADTARDLDHLRALMGEEKLTYIGLSYGSYLGETYANMFPDRVRAIVLDGIVDPVRYSKSAEARVAMWSDAADDVFGRFLSLCGGAGPERCALAGGGRSPAERWQRLRARLKRGPIPAPTANLHGVARDTLSYSDLLISQFQPLRAPVSWPQNARDIDAAVRGDGSALETGASFFRSPTGWAAATASAAIQCAEGRPGSGHGRGGRCSSDRSGSACSRERSTSRGSGPPAPPGRCAPRTHTEGRGTNRPRTRSC
jgi:pimeloyl-ACP methyl ester carboxylesterase